MAFYRIPDSHAAHTSLNPSQNSQANFFYFARYHPFRHSPLFPGGANSAVSCYFACGS
jgi:hypothetical protein